MFKQNLNYKQIVFGFIIGLGTIIILAYCDSTPKKSDKELYFIFYKEIIEQCRLFDEKLKPFLNAIDQNDTIDAINIASNINDDLSQLASKINEVSIPSLINKDAQKGLEQSKEYFSNCYFNRHQAVSDFIEYSKNPSPFTLAKVAKNKDKMSAQSLLGAAVLITAGSKLGLSIDEIQNSGK